MITTFLAQSAALTLTNGGTIGLAPGTNQVLTELKGWHGSAPVRRESTDRLWAHGSFSERGWKGERVITMSGHVTAETRTEAAGICDELAALFGDGELGRFTVNDVDQGTRYADVYLAGRIDVDWDSDREIDFTLDMVAPDPRKYGGLEEYVTGSAVPGGGLDNDPSLFNNTENVLDFGDGGPQGSVTIVNTGTAPSTLIFEVHGLVPASGFIITESGTGRQLVYSSFIHTGDYLVLNSADGTVLMNGVSDRSVNLTRREWPVLKPGSNSYIFDVVESPAALMIARAASAWW